MDAIYVPVCNANYACAIHINPMYALEKVEIIAMARL